MRAQDADLASMGRPRRLVRETTDRGKRREKEAGMATRMVTVAIVACSDVAHLGKGAVALLSGRVALEEVTV